MKYLNISAITFAVSLVFSPLAIAEPMTKTQYEFLSKNIEVSYKVAKAGCSALTANAKDVCVSEAKGNRSITKAVLKDNLKSTVKSRYDVHAAIAESDYSVASMKCDGGIASSKIACINAAKTIRSQQMADAMHEIRTSKPDVAED